MKRSLGLLVLLAGCASDPDQLMGSDAITELRQMAGTVVIGPRCQLTEQLAPTDGMSSWQVTRTGANPLTISLAFETQEAIARRQTVAAKPYWIFEGTQVLSWSVHEGPNTSQEFRAASGSALIDLASCQ